MRYYMNILVLSSGTRNKIVQYFKAALTRPDGTRSGKVVATDMSPLAPSLYDADSHYVVPPMGDPRYLDVIYDICRKERISGVLSLIDPELSLLARHEEDFKALGVQVVGSSYELCEMSLDKMEMFAFCQENGFDAATSWDSEEDFYQCLEAGEVEFPVFVKPQRGSASLSINKVNNRQTVELLFSNAAEDEHLMIQELLDGQEFGADCYIDLISGELVSVFIKKKIVMRAGETDKAVSFKDEVLLQMIKEFCGKAGYRGQIDIDIFKVGDRYYISEVNPRFGGGYPHAYECGVDHMKLIVNNLQGKVNQPAFNTYDEGVYMMKYSDVSIVTL